LGVVSGFGFQGDGSDLPQKGSKDANGGWGEEMRDAGFRMVQSYRKESQNPFFNIELPIFAFLAPFGG